MKGGRQSPTILGRFNVSKSISDQKGRIIIWNFRSNQNVIHAKSSSMGVRGRESAAECNRAEEEAPTAKTQGAAWIYAVQSEADCRITSNPVQIRSSNRSAVASIKQQRIHSSG